VPRELPRAHRRMAEESVRLGMAAAVVMEAAAREWIALEGEEPFPDYLVRREVLRREQVEELAKVVAAEAEGEPAPGAAAGGGEAPRVPHPSEVIKGYRILERLGRGGMGSVYRAEQVGMNRVVALKILRRPFGEVEEHVERLRREARLVGALDHPNIVRGLDVGQHGPYHYFAMEFVEGETLRDLLKRRGVIPEAEALRLVEQVALALDHAHSRGIVHRDVKPGNIIVTPDGTPKLTDYGLAKGPADFTLTQSGVTIGTPQYISPEQAKDPVGVGIQTDLYSLGATAYHMLTGIPPHASDTLAGLLTKVLYEKPRTARQVHPKVSAGASFLVEKMMAKQVRHRYREPREVLRDLRSLAAGKSIVPSHWAGDFEVHEARRRVRQYAGAAAAVVVIALGGTVYLQWRTERKARIDRELAAEGRMASIEAGEPASREDWEKRRDLLEKFLDEERYRDTKAHAVAKRRHQEAQEHIGAFIQAGSFLNGAKALEEQRRYRDAMVLLRQAIPSFQTEDRKRYGRQSAMYLQEEIRRIQEAGRAETGQEIARALDRARKAPVVEGTAGHIQEDLEKTRALCLGQYLEEGDFTRDMVDLDDVLNFLERARSDVEESRFGPGFRDAAARLLANDDYASLEEEIRRAGDALAQDPALQDLLGRVPGPAAADLRGRAERELSAVRDANAAWLKGVFARARELADAGRFEAALEALERAENRSVKELAGGAADLRKEVDARRKEAERTGAEKVAAFWGAFVGDLVRRDFLVARQRAGEGAASAAVAEAAASANHFLDLLQIHGLDPVGRRIDGKGVRELQFLKDGRLQQRYREATNVHRADSDTGPVILFDEPGQPNLRGELHRLALDLLLAYAGLDAGGLTNEQALVRAALVVIAAEAEKVERRELEAAAGQLRRVRDQVPDAGPVVDALLARAEGLVEARIRADRNFEEDAARTYQEAVGLVDSNPKDAIWRLNSLLDLFKGTEFVKANRAAIQKLLATSLTNLRDKAIEGYYPGARVEVIPGEAGVEARTRIRWSFDTEDQAQGFVRLEDAPYRILVDPPPDGNGGPRDGRLLFLDGGAGRGLAESPLSLECLFKTARYMAVQFRYHPEESYYLQVSIAGNHVGVLTDDGRKVSGRGVYAWQKGDWQGADLMFPQEYRHDFLPKGQNLATFRTEEGLKYFQFEKGETYDVRVEWDRQRLRLFVGGSEVWSARMKRDTGGEKPPRIRILTYSRAWIDDLSVEGVVDRDWFGKLLNKK
jgi:tRNA A-37 threonylcarbamoyl transferase component Bud32